MPMSTPSPSAASTPSTPPSFFSAPAPSSTSVESPAAVTPNVPPPSNVFPGPTVDTPFAATTSGLLNIAGAGFQASGNAGDAHPRKKSRREDRPPPAVEFINSTAVTSGAAYVVPKATRRTRSDKGVRRGPRKKTASTVDANAVTVSDGSQVNAGARAAAIAQAKKGKRTYEVLLSDIQVSSAT
ncbi:hypothetical protein FKP32DRAFT_1677180 [Trametes sanguinea]|nr:hypothetical protein FKP32DRAFT_1677180 [Trametes sanguinea]